MSLSARRPKCGSFSESQTNARIAWSHRAGLACRWNEARDYVSERASWQKKA